MGTKATRKDFYMEIRKSPGRFLSILFIVALGVAFFSGIRSSEPDMRVTGDAYFDGSDLMDLQVMSTYGITEKDLRAFEKVDGVAAAEGGYSADFLSTLHEEQTVLHVMSLQDQVNQVTVSEGRLPKKPGECLADNQSGYAVGDTIRLESGTGDAVSDTLKTDTLEVVGTGSSPCYVSFGRGSTTIGTGSLTGFLVVTKDTFDTEVYTEAYLLVDGAKELTAYTDDYDARIEEVADQVEAMTGERGQIRRQELIDEANEELDEARQELQDGKEKAKQELADAKAAIEDGEAQLAEGKQELADGREQLNAAKDTLEAKQKELDAGFSEYKSGRKQLEEGQEAYEQGKEAYEKEKAQAEAQLADGQKELDKLQAQIEADREAYGSLESGIEQLKQQIEAEEADGADESMIAGMKAKLEELKGNLALLGQKIQAEEQGFQEGSEKLEGYRQQLKEGKDVLDSTKKQLQASKKELDKAYDQLQDGQAQIDAAWKELKASEQELADGAAAIEENEAKLEEAREEYEAGKKEAEEEIAEGEKEIADAEKEIADIGLPDWYVNDRGNLPEYDGYGENADRMRAIGRVFPVIFFLVAALISLTSMTRMVEEQRIEIGTMKALGYDRLTIASKYLGYALLATAGGSVIGVLVGEKVLPYIIVYAYGIMYQNLPKILVPYNWGYAGMASAAAVVCTMAATLMACYKEMGAQPAVLMRPPAPKKGQRVLLERVKIIWNHLSFTWKSTVRNLVRYKKRFFMTVFGIGGCMALMLVGFGIKDSVFEIADLQYGELQFYDGSIYPEEDLTEEERQNLDAFLEQDEDVKDFMDVHIKNMTLESGKESHDAYVCVLGEPEKQADFVNFRDRRTHEGYELTDQGAIISEKTADLLDVKEGDAVTIQEDHNGTGEIKVAHICENYMGHYLYLTPAAYERVYGEEPEYNAIFFKGPDGMTEDEVEQVGQKILAEDEVLSVSYTHDLRAQLDDMLVSLNLVIVVLIISAGMLAFVVLYNLNNINITERQRELATLRVLGFYNLEVAEYVYRENVILTFFGAAFGIALGRVLHLFVIQTVEVDAAMFGRNVNFVSYVYSLAFTLIFTAIVNFVMYFKLKKINMVEALKSIE